MTSETEPLWIPDDVKHDPAARSSLMEQLRVQILQKTRDVPETNRLVVRERLRRQLDRAGFDMVEATYILSSLDEPREPASPDPKTDVASERGRIGRRRRPPAQARHRQPLTERRDRPCASGRPHTSAVATC